MSRRLVQAGAATLKADATALPSWTSVLAVVAHPDDESFGLGAVLDAFIRAGAAVSVLCLTHGEASTLGSGASLGDVRAKELKAAADHIGIGSTVLLDYRDGLLSDVAHDVLASEVLRELEARPVDGLVVFDSSGITGHPDHMAATRSALEAAGQLDLPVLAWTLPSRVVKTLNEEFDAGFCGHSEKDVDMVVRVERDRQRSAALCHASQAVPGSVLWRRLQLLGDHEHLRWLSLRVTHRLFGGQVSPDLCERAAFADASPRPSGLVPWSPRPH